jgi:uncharacterized membrane-anchored protein
MQTSRKTLGTVAAAAVLCLLAAQPSAFAQNAASTLSPEGRRAERIAAWQAGEKAAIRGPASVALADQADLKLPTGDIFIPKAEGGRIMSVLGNAVHEESFVGLIVGTGANDRWMVVVRNYRDGYIKDDDAKNWNADDLLRSLQENNSELNKQRVVRGLHENEILGWVEKPAYDATTHRLVWSLLSRLKAEPGTIETGINYNTYALGRAGYLSLNLLTAASRIEADKAVAQQLLSATTYRPGKGYTDFNAATDRVAAYGLTALIGGVAVAKKLGWLALIGAIAVKFSKLIGAAVIAFAAGVWKLARRRAKPTTEPTTAS